MIRKWVIGIGLVGISVLVIAGDRVDFSGEWVFDASQSTLDAMGNQFLPTRLLITQSENELVVKKVLPREYDEAMTIEEKVTLDGKETRSEAWNIVRLATATFSEEGKAITVDTRLTFEMGGTLSLKETYRLSHEGQTLTIDHHSTSEWGERDLKLVYNRVVPAKTQE